MKYKAGYLLLGVLGLLVAASAIVLSMNPAALDLPKGSTPVTRVPAAEFTPMNATHTSDLPILAPAMPEFAGIARWWNTPDGQALTPASLKGKVVLIDFWTYSCINCIRTQPFMRKIWETYKDDGLVIVGVHTPEFAFEKVPANVENALKKAGLEYPIALDPEYATWNAYSNHYWPAGYFFDRQGRLRFTHFGEGSYDEQENIIRELLAEETPLTDPMTGAGQIPRFELTKTHETYFGSLRLANLANPEYEPGVEKTYQLRETAADQWSLGGTWKITDEYAIGLQAGTKFRMNVESNAMHLVLGSMNGPKTIKVTADGEGAGTIQVDQKQLYTVARFPDGGRHTIEIELVEPGIEFYAATFGE
ncbi:redoxin family protein [Candidatus Uhrbacteria bacterium]|nr:redoxin family protein [Candidatus Uhrbacteria bacterium]